MLEIRHGAFIARNRSCSDAACEAGNGEAVHRRDGMELVRLDL
ncbi:hypothetical protein [Streptomyces durmitorensis]|nr:hypothetical protein [Streptomyces durmitorensis]